MYLDEFLSIVYENNVGLDSFSESTVDTANSPATTNILSFKTTPKLSDSSIGPIQRGRESLMTGTRREPLSRFRLVSAVFFRLSPPQLPPARPQRLL